MTCVKRITAEKPEVLELVAESCYIPKDDGNKPLGEDAHFYSADKQTIGVADGVGAWALKGIDAGEFARKLMQNAEDAVCKQPDGEIDPKEVMMEAFLKTNVQGSCTACIITFSGDYLHAANVGDSGFLIIREGKIVYQSPKQQFRFNAPYKLGKDHPKNNPSRAEEIKVPVKVGDVIVAATDGLFDNLHDFEIEKIVAEGIQASDKLEERLALAAYENSLNQDYPSPFAVEAWKAGIQRVGGKPDDITVVVAAILPEWL